jgi:hypothetical protein
MYNAEGIKYKSFVANDTAQRETSKVLQVGLATVKRYTIFKRRTIVGCQETTYSNV